MGSKSDYEVVYEAAKILNEFGAAYEMIVSSAHRSPARTAKYVADAEKKGAQVFICAAGMAAHLAGAVAANTTKPVLGVPLGGSALSGVDALAIGKAGAKNAAYLAVQILALSDEVLSSKLKADRAAKAEALKKDSEQIEVLLED